MRQSINLLRRLIVLLLIFLAIPNLIGQANFTNQSSPVPLEQAIISGLVDVKAIPNQPGMSQPNLLLTISTRAGDSLEIQIQAGTVLAPISDSRYSPLIIPDDQNLLVNQKLDFEISTFSLNSVLLQPNSLSPIDYGFSTINPDPNLFNLFQLSRDHQYGYGYDVQLAVWAVAENRSIEEIIEGMPTPPTFEVQTRAACLLQMKSNCADPVLSPTVQPTPVPTDKQLILAVTPTVGIDPNGSDVIPILITFGVIGVIAAIVILVVVSRKRSVKSAERQGGIDWGVEVSQKPQPPDPQKPEKRSPELPTPPIEKPISPTLTSITLKAVKGAHQGKTFSGDLPFVVSRNALRVVVIAEPTISAPHAMFDLAESGLEVKDMNSSNGVVVNDIRIHSGWQAVESGQPVFLGRAEFAFEGKSFQVLSGQAAGSTYGPFNDPVLISRDPLNVVKLGADDGNISDAHILFFAMDNQVQIRDLSSRYGTQINGVAASRNQILKPGDHIQLGLSEFIYQAH